MKLFKMLALCIVIVVMSLSFSACTDKSPVGGEDFYIKVNDEFLSKEYISYFFYIAENEMLSEAGYTSDKATEEDIDTYWSTAEIDGKNAVDVARDLAADNAVQQKLQYHQALNEGISLSESEIKEIEETLLTASESKGGHDTFETVLSEAGTDINAYKQILTENSFIQKLYDKYDSDGKLAVSAEDLNRIKAEFGDSVTDEECIDYLKKEAFNSMVDNLKKDADIEINDEKMKEITIG